jgi:hypothetical protein
VVRQSAEERYVIAEEVSLYKSASPEQRKLHPIPHVSWLDFIAHREIQAKTRDADRVRIDVNPDQILLQQAPEELGPGRALKAVGAAPPVDQSLKRLYEEDARTAARI